MAEATDSQMDDLARSIRQRQQSDDGRRQAVPEIAHPPVVDVVRRADVAVLRRAAVDADGVMARRKSDRRESMYRKLVKAAGERYANCRFSNWSVGGDEDARLRAEIKAMVQEWASTYPERVKASTNLVLYGPVGTGKDHLAFAAVRQAVLQHDATVQWINGRDLVGDIRDRITLEQTESSLISSIRSPQCVVISDPLPPAGPLSSHQMDMMFRIVHARYSDGKLTVMTLNVVDDFDADTNLGVPTWDRLCDRAWKAHFDLDSNRRPSRVVSRKKK